MKQFESKIRATYLQKCAEISLVWKLLSRSFHWGPNSILNTFTCLGENTGKYITFIVPIEKEVTRINKNGEEVTKNISYILQFIDSGRFMASSLSSLSQ